MLGWRPHVPPTVPHLTPAKLCVSTDPGELSRGAFRLPTQTLAGGPKLWISVRVKLWFSTHLRGKLCGSTLRIENRLNRRYKNGTGGGRRTPDA